MQIIIPAYNVKADQATRYEAQIAAIMHMHRDKEINWFKNDKLPHAAPKAGAHAAAPKLPEGEKKLTGSARGRENNATDELVLRVLANKEMSISEIADAVNFSRQLVRHVVDRLLSRKEIARRNTHDRVTLFYKIGEQVHVE
jgi:predicted transcriptional regulator